MIVVFYELESANRGRVVSVNMQAEELAEEIRNKGLEVEFLEEPEFQIGKMPIQYINPSTKEIWYEYVDRELTSDEEIILLKSENEFLKKSQTSQDELIMSLMLGGM